MELDWDNMNNIIENKTSKPEEVYEEYEYEEYYEDVLEEDSVDAAANEAVKRIEQAKLYESLLKHDFFAPGSARPEIQNKVTSEIRTFILDRLNVLVGLKQEESRLDIPNAALPWDDNQISALTSIADRLVSKKVVDNRPSQPVVRQFSGNTDNPKVNVVKTQEQPVVQPSSRQPKIRKVLKQQPATQKTEGSPLPEGTKRDPLTGNPMTDNGIVLYKGQVQNKKNAGAKMPSQRQIDQMNASQVQRSTAGQSIGDKMLGLAISNAQLNNKNIIEED